MALQLRARRLHEDITALFEGRGAAGLTKAERLLKEAGELARTLADPTPVRGTKRAAGEFSDALLWFHVRVAYGHDTPSDALAQLKEMHDELFPPRGEP